MSGRAIGLLTGLNLGGAVLGVLNSVLVAHLFGTSRLLEAYFAAVTTQAMVVSLSQTGQLGDIFLPQYHRIRQAEGPESARHAFSALAGWMVLASAALAALLWVAAPLVLRLLVPGFDPEAQALAAAMFRVLVLLIPLQIACALATVLCNAERWFGRPELLAVCSQAVSLATIALLWRPLGVWGLVAGLWAGQLVLGAGLVRALRGLGFRYVPALRHPSFRVSSVFVQLGYTFGYVGATQVYAFAANAALSLLPQGTYAVFKYVQQLYAKTNTVLIRPVGVVLFTYASDALARGGAGVREMVRRALSRNLGIASVTAAAVLAGSHPLLAALWGSERFGAAELELAARLLAVFFLLLYAEGAGQVARRVAMAAGLVRSSYLSAACAQLLSAAVFWGVVSRWGVPGIAPAIAAAVVMLNAAYWLPLLVRRPDLAAFYDAGEALRWAAAVAAGLGAALLVRGALPGAGGRLEQLGEAALLAGAAAGTAVVLAWTLRVPEVTGAVRWLRAAAARGAS